ncbi:MAG: hypothetical protein AAF617_02955 [Bacteroidota bacterium]
MKKKEQNSYKKLNKKKMNRKLTVVALSLVVVTLYNCTTNTIAEEEIADLPPIVESITYDEDVAPIFENNCVGCHSGPAAVAGLALDGYANARAGVEQGNVIPRINDVANPMPQTGLMPAADRQIIEQWATDGFLEN